MRTVLLFLGMLLAVSTAHPSVDQVTDLVALGKECQKNLDATPLVFKMKIEGSGDMGTWKSNESELHINWLSITGKNIELLSVSIDTMRCPPLRLVPALPKFDRLLGISTMKEMVIILGIPSFGRIGEGDLSTWGFFAIDDKELRILTISARIERSSGSDRLLGVEIATGSIARNHISSTTQPKAMPTKEKRR